MSQRKKLVLSSSVRAFYRPFLAVLLSRFADGLVSVVVPIDKLSILFTVLFAGIFRGEWLSKKAWLGLGMILAGTLLLL